MQKLTISILTFGLFLMSSIGISATSIWSSADEFLIPKGQAQKLFPYGKFLRNPLDPTSSKNHERFDFFYYTVKPFDPTKKTVIFLSGGPGRVLGPAPADLSVLRDAYNVVYYHPRGGGLSELPLDSSFDRYITSENIVHDIESIRINLGIKKWDMVYGFSHGTILAQMYGHMYPKSTKRFVYDGTTTWWDSRHHKIMTLQTCINLQEIMKLDRDHVFADLTDKDKEDIVSLVRRILVETDKPDGLQQLLITGDIKKPETIQQFPVLKGLSLQFLNAVDMALYMGWSPVNPDLATKQKAVSILIAGELFPKKINRSVVNESRQYISNNMYPAIKTGAIEIATKANAIAQSDVSRKISFPGWSNRIFLTIYGPESGDSPDPARPIYMPQNYKHDVETIMLGGSGDGVCPIDGVMEVFNTLLTGPRILFMATGSNHGAFFKNLLVEKDLMIDLVEANLNVVSHDIRAAGKNLPDGLEIKKHRTNSCQDLIR